MQGLSNRQPIKLSLSAKIGIKPMLRHQNCQQTNAKASRRMCGISLLVDLIDEGNFQRKQDRRATIKHQSGQLQWMNVCVCLVGATIK